MRTPWSTLLLSVVAIACSDRTISAPTLAAPSPAADRVGAPNDADDDATVGGVFTETDDPTSNAVVAFARRADGTLRYVANYPTGGRGLTRSRRPLAQAREAWQRRRRRTRTRSAPS